MKEPERLFDLIDRRRVLCPERPVFSNKKNGQWEKHYIDEYIEKSNLLSYAFMHLGVQKGEHIALISTGRPEWNYIDMGVQMMGAVLLPIYPTISESEYLYILSHAEVRYLIVEGETLYKKIGSIRNQLPSIEEVYTLNPIEGASNINDLYAMGDSHRDPDGLQAIKDSITTDDVATLIYTSGSTGTPKGVMLSHKGIILNVLGIKDSPGKDWTRALSWMPLCHIYERMMNYLYQYLCMEIYYAESIAKVADNAQETNPYMMAAVPRFIEKMYDKVFRKGEKLMGFKKKIFDWALDLGFEYELNDKKRTLWYNIRHSVADRLVYAEIRKALGANFHMLVSGGASIQPRLTRFFSAVGLDLYEGYGLTECSPLVAVTNSYAEEGRKVGSVGFVLPGIEVQIHPETHEIMCRGGNVMKGYFKAPELTAEAIDSEGWFHTGDTGYIDSGGYMFLTGRTKNMFKTSMGKFVNPEVIEERFKESPFILDMMVVGEGQKFAAAIIAPDFDMLKDWCGRHDVVASTREEMLASKTVQERYQKVIDKYNATLGNHEQVKRFRMVPEVWSTENQFLTPTLKIKRNNITSYYKKEIEELFV
ncbi:MAG: long-chain fatty acid--CoA ligase [Bacteroidales bacterium]|nr:long-chain fatty acid--CoA ligase [Bacteroidales bacterium]